jgi:hypothetical protein
MGLQYTEQPFGPCMRMEIGTFKVPVAQSYPRLERAQGQDELLHLREGLLTSGMEVEKIF